MTQKKISRRDAIKILSAALGGAALSAIPPKWSKPALAASQLPEHARQSVLASIVANPITSMLGCQNKSTFDSSAQIFPPRGGVFLRYEITEAIPPTTIVTPSPGTIPTANDGSASVTINASSAGGGAVTVTWSFVNPADGIGSDSQTASNTGC